MTLRLSQQWRVPGESPCLSVFYAVYAYKTSEFFLCDLRRSSPIIEYRCVSCQAVKTGDRNRQSIINIQDEEEGHGWWKGDLETLIACPIKTWNQDTFHICVTSAQKFYWGTGNLLHLWKQRTPGGKSVQKYNKTCNVRINVILMRVRVSLLPWKRNKYYTFWVCVCSLSYPASKARAPYFIVICGLSGSITFFHTSKTARFSEKRYRT